MSCDVLALHVCRMLSLQPCQQGSNVRNSSGASCSGRMFGCPAPEPGQCRALATTRRPFANLSPSLSSGSLSGRSTALQASSDRKGKTTGSSGTAKSLNQLDSLGLEQAVPWAQRPSNELQELRGDWLYAWGTLPLPAYAQRLAIVFAAFSAVISGPIAYQTFDPFSQPLEFALASSTGSLFVVAVAALRIYLGWTYVSDRLMSAAVPYEETGWYDGEVFVKPPEILTRDRLLGIYECKPVLQRLKTTMLGAAVALLVVSITLFGLVKSGSDADGMYGRSASRAPPRSVTADGILFSKTVSDVSRLKYDDEAAAAEAEARGNIPGYCADRYYRAAAGGQYCDKFDL